MMVRSLGIHLGVLVLASALGARAWMSDDAGDSEDEIDVWGGNANAVELVEYESDSVKVRLEAKADTQGRFFVGEIDREKKSDRPPGPHGQPPEPKPEGEPEREQVRFVSVDDGAELVEQLAPLSATRSLGKIAPERDAEFGFEEGKTARLSVVIGGERRELVVGSSTPGGNDYYAKTADGEAFVLDGEIARDLISAEGRLMERSYRSWKDDEEASVKVKTEAGVRELRLGPEQKFWADAQSPEEKDETATNWMEKLQRLRIIEYVAEPPAGLRPLFGVEFFGAGGKRLGSVELAAAPSPEGDKEEYFARSEHTRWWGRVLGSSAEQLSQDVSGVVSE